ncbi:uncharacterized protein ACR2FA_005431 [Aphomia sociella]
MKWDQDNTLFFIKLIRERPVLWDATCSDHKDKIKKLDALIEISKIIGITKEEVNLKWISLKGQYNREKKKVTDLKTGSGRGHIYYSKWFAYKEMSSLISFNNPQDPKTNFEHNSIPTQTVSAPPPITPTPPPTTPTPPPTTPTPPPITPTPPPTIPIPPPTMPIPPPTMPIPPPTTPTPSSSSLPPAEFSRAKNESGSHKRNRYSSLYSEAMLTLKALKDKKTKTPELNDEITAYGLYIAAQMRKFQPTVQSRLKLDIQTLLCKYEMENLEQRDLAPV